MGIEGFQLYEGLLKSKVPHAARWVPICSTGLTRVPCKMGMRTVPTSQGQETPGKESA